jgi:hypothetical protein
VVDAEAALRAGPAAARPSYNAARVYAQAAGRALDAPRADLRAVARHEQRAVALLRQAMDRLPAAERDRFWHDMVANDPALRVLRRAVAFQPLAAEFDGRPGG